MEAKTFEVRDTMTFIPVLAIRLLPTTEKDRYLLARSGYGLTPSEQAARTIVIKLNEVTAKNDWPLWQMMDGTRTMSLAHHHIEQKWDSLQSGEVIDVEWIAGERPTRKISQSAEHPI